VDRDLLIAKLMVADARRRHEDELIGQRVVLLVISQSFLFGTFAAVNNQRNAHPAKEMAELLFRLVPVIGLVLACFVFAAVVAAVSSLWSWQREIEHLSDLPEVQALDWPMSRRTKRTHMVVGHCLPVMLSVCFIVAWATVLGAVVVP
jgi:hypothetical protein